MSDRAKTDDPLMLEDRPIARDQKRANWLMEAIGSMSLLALLGLVWFAAQQSKNLDIALKTVEGLVLQTQNYQQGARQSMQTMQRDVDRLGGQVEGIKRDVEHNRRNIDKIESRVLAPPRAERASP